MVLKNILISLTFFLVFTAAAPTSRAPPPNTPAASMTAAGPTSETCPKDSLKMGICVKAINLFNVTLGTPPVTPCCSLIHGLIDVEAAVCLCTAIKASIFGVNVDVVVNLSFLLNVCSRKPPSGFQCPS